MLSMVIIGAMMFEVLQNFIPGRYPDIFGFVASSLGGWFGLTMAILSRAVLKAISKKPG